MPYFGLLARRITPWIFVLLLSLGLHHDAFADTNSATIGVTVSDSTRAIVPGATVVIRSADTTQEQHLDTAKNGTAVFSYLKPGRYSLTVSKENFSPITVDGIVLAVGDNKQFSLTLKIGSSTATVNVDGSGPNINTTDGSVSTVVDRRFVENLPLNGRSFQDLILLTPGVTTNSPQTGSTSGYSGEFNINGQRSESNAYYVDGVSANTGGYIYGYGTSGTSGSLPAATALGTTQSLASVDALQEFRVASSTYSAEYGLSPGGQLSFVTRSGTKDLHGTAYDYLRNNFFDANDWFNNNLNKPITPLRQNDFGGTLGGPILIPRIYNGRARSFFFFSYEGLRLMQPQAALTYYVPTKELRQSADRALQSALNAFPLPSGSEVTVPCNTTTYLCPQGQPIGTPVPSGLAPFVQVDSLPSRIDSTSVRFDHQITSSTKVFYRFSNTQSSKQTRQLSTLSPMSQSAYTNTLGLTRSATERMVVDLRLNYTSNRGADSNVLDTFGGAQQADLLKLQGLSDPTAYDVFELTFPGYTTYLKQGGTTQPQHMWDVVGSTTVAVGLNTIKIGGEYRRLGSRLQQTNPSVANVFNSSQSLQANSSYLSVVQEYGRTYPSYLNAALYVQDDLRLSRRLGLSAGIRWEVNPPPTQASGSLPYILEGDIATPSSLRLAPAGTAFWKTTYFNFAPRVGFAYQARTEAGKETVIRGGGGIFFDSGQQASTQAFGNSPGDSATAQYANVSYPLTPSQLKVQISDPPTPPYYSTYYFSDRQQLPYTWQWNLSLEQGLGTNQTVTFSYVGSNGRRLLSQQLVTPGKASPNFTNIYNEMTGTSSSYNALQIQFRRTLSRGFQFLGSYNWAHSLDFGSQNIAYSQIRGNSDFDLRHNFNAALSYEIPSHFDTFVLRTLSTGWGVDGRVSTRTGFPVTLNGNTIIEPNGQAGYSGLDLVANTPLYIHLPGVAGNRRISPAAFALPSAGETGDAPRNLVRGFGDGQVDIAVRRSFPIGERLSIQFRAESFNVLNHPNFGYIQPTYGNIQFGEATGMLNQGLGGVSPLYQQGGPRSMQFALKCIF